MKDGTHKRIHWVGSKIKIRQNNQLSRVQRPQLLGIPEQDGISLPVILLSPEDVAKTESFFSKLKDPQCGQSACPSHSLVLTRTSESLLHSPQ